MQTHTMQGKGNLPETGLAVALRAAGEASGLWRRQGEAAAEVEATAAMAGDGG
jgi:hypothetical protein